MTQVLVTLAVVVLATALTTNAGPSQQSADGRVLDKWLGIWRSHTVLKPAAWSLKAEERSGTSKAEWILDGRFQQIASQSGEHETREIHRYDAKSEKYHKWIFDSNGGHSFWIGGWDEASSTMTWDYVDFGIGIQGKIVNRFLSDEEYGSTLVMKDGTGNLLLDIQSEHTRTEKQAR